MRLHHIVAAIYVLSAKVIGAALAGYSSMDLLGLFTADNASVNTICASKAVYLTAPYAGMFLDGDLLPVEDWMWI